MILKGLFRKLKFVIVLIVIIVVIAIVLKVLKLKPAVEKMIKEEFSLSRLRSAGQDSASDSAESSPAQENPSWEERIGSFLFPSQSEKNKNQKPELVRSKRKKTIVQAAPPEQEDFEDEENYRSVEDNEPETRGRDPTRRKNSKTSTYKREELCRAFFENYFDDYFPTCRPKFLTNPKTGKPLELDGYNARLNLSFEHDGLQHRVYTPRFHSSPEDFAKQQERDVFKRKRLEELGIDLIEISDQVPTAQLESFLLRAVRELGH
jgi:hypothetical protein